MPLFNRNPQFLAQIFTQYIRAIVQILIWAVIGLASLAGAYVAVRAIWLGVGFVLKAIGI